MAEPLWNFRNAAHRDTFSELLKPLIVASRTRDFATPAVAKHQLIVWVMSLADVPLEILNAGVERLVGQGVTWMPRPGDLREACAAIIGERRRAAGRIAAEMQATCEHCDTTGWRAVLIDGVERVTRCECFTAGQTLIAAAGAPIARPQLPAAVELDA